MKIKLTIASICTLIFVGIALLGFNWRMSAILAHIDDRLTEFMTQINTLVDKQDQDDKRLSVIEQRQAAMHQRMDDIEGQINHYHKAAS